MGGHLGCFLAALNNAVTKASIPLVLTPELKIDLVFHLYLLGVSQNALHFLLINIYTNKFIQI